MNCPICKKDGLNVPTRTKGEWRFCQVGHKFPRQKGDFIHGFLIGLLFGVILFINIIEFCHNNYERAVIEGMPYKPYRSLGELTEVFAGKTAKNTYQFITFFGRRLDKNYDKLWTK